LRLGAAKEAARRQSDAIRQRLRRDPVRLDGRERNVSVTIGAATAEAGEPSDLFAAADRALYEGKKLSKTAGWNWWRRRGAKPRPGGLRGRALHAQPLLQSCSPRST